MREDTGKPGLVSVVVATYNMAEYVTLAVRSALDQTHRDIEVLVIDDGSTDATSEAVSPLLGDSRVRYVVKENAGQASAKNRGIREAAGDYIAFLDSDDLWSPDKLAKQLPLFSASSSTGVVYSGFKCIDTQGRSLPYAAYTKHRGRVTGALLFSNFLPFSSCIVRRQCFERLGLFDESLRMGIDYDLWLRFSLQYEFDFVDRELLSYRHWPGQMSQDWRRRYQSGIAIMERFLQQNPDAVDKGTVDEAWAHTYAGYAYCARGTPKGRLEALHHYIRALRFRPGYMPAWRGIGATMLGR